MHDFFLGTVLAIMAMVVLCIIRVIMGPGIINRIVAANMIGTKTIAVVLLIGEFYHRLDFFIDIALVYALINFLGTLAFTKYFEKRGFLQGGTLR
jgi:multicomponent Na+:H+ antiporter subunit F